MVLTKQGLLWGTLAAAAVFSVSGVLGWVYAEQLAHMLMPSMEGLQNMVEATNELEPELQAPALAALIFLKNLSVAGFLILLGYIVLALPTLFVLIVNGGLIGVVAHSLTTDGFPAIAFAAGLVPHGIFELPAIFLAGGFALAAVSGRFNGRKLPALGSRFSFIIKTIAPLLLVAAVIEVYITPLVLRPFLS